MNIGVTPGKFLKSLFAVWGRSGAYWQQMWLFCGMNHKLKKNRTKIWGAYIFRVGGIAPPPCPSLATGLV